MPSKACDKCGKDFTGFGTTCSDCRKAGLKSSGTAKACSVCGTFFSGFGDNCEDCAKGDGTRKKIAEKSWDEDGLPNEENNVDGIGSEEDKANREKAAAGEPAWDGIGLEPGLWIFRIESFKPIAWPRAKYGQFHEGDSYICLHAQKDVDETGAEVEKLTRDIFFWLGESTSTDEKGTAAYKTVELDDFFGGSACQHRETQSNESAEFQDLFPKGIVYLEGGVASGFKATQVDIFVNKLWQVRRNAKKAIIIEEEQVELKSLNHRDAFILDTGRKIYTWFGDNCSPFVKNACNMRAENMESERDGESTVYSEVDDVFWAALGGEGEITAADKVGEELPPDFGEGILFNVQVTDAGLEIKEVARGELERHMLDPTGVMMLDTRTELFLWLGKEANVAEKRSALKTGTNYLKMNGRSVDKTAITVLKQGSGRKNKTWLSIFPLK